MKESVVALLGQGTGPSIPTFGKKAFLRVSGLNGGSVRANFAGGSVGQLEFHNNGDYDLPEGVHSVEVCCEIGGDNLIAEVVRG